MRETVKEENLQDKRRLRVEISGAVQGVGFRPFVYRLATALTLRGWVINDTRGVFIEVEGAAASLTTFLDRLTQEAPPNAHIVHMTHDWLEMHDYDRFEIRHSDSDGARRVIVLPDLATCPDCRKELFDPTNRRHRYPFTNCTNCGPRFTIVEALPYDRPNTTMRGFVLCPVCQQEYIDPLDRRFHAQPNACPVCGPELTLYGKNGVESDLHGDAALLAAVEAIRCGDIVAIKGLGGFHLIVDARNRAAVRKLRIRKQRPAKPLAVMVDNLDQAAALCELLPQAAEFLQSPAAPIVLLPRRLDAAITAEVAPDNPDLGVMLAYTPLHHLLLTELGFPVVATSGNLTDEPICTDEWEAMARLGEIADAFLVHNRPIARHADDSVLWIVGGEPQMLRRARGYAPLPVQVANPLPTILGVGAHLKNTIALSLDQQVFLSQHIGDLETAPAYDAFQRVIADFLSLYDAQPTAIAHDLHPEYLSTKWAKAKEKERLEIEDWRLENGGEGNLSSENPLILNLPISQSLPLLIPVQHHHAHLAACLADNDASGPALGLIWDGTGYGLDGTIWGGECLLGDAGGFTRMAHLRPFRLPGGDAAVREPRRVAMALLWSLYGDDVFTWDWLAPVRSFTEPERRLLAAMLAKGVNAPVTTSMGRLFDGVAALIGLHPRVTFEGQAAMALEHLTSPSETNAYRFTIAAGNQGSPAVLDWAPVVTHILNDLRCGTDGGTIAARFHHALTDLGVAVAHHVGQGQVALSGGCFQNRRLTELLVRRLRSDGFTVLLHRQVPPNDGCISLGQVMVAARRLEIDRAGN